MLYSMFPSFVYFIHSSNNVYVSIPVSQFLPPHSFPPWYPYICSVCLCLYFCFANKMIYTIFSRFHTYALSYDICFSLSDLLHPVWYSLGPSTSLQMTQVRSFLWLSNIPLYILIPSETLLGRLYFEKCWDVTFSCSRPLILKFIPICKL